VSRNYKILCVRKEEKDNPSPVLSLFLRLFHEFPPVQDFGVDDNPADGTINLVPGPALPPGVIHRTIQSNERVIGRTQYFAGKGATVYIPPPFRNFGKDIVMPTSVTS
jgi:hypothetical protein